MRRPRLRRRGPAEERDDDLGAMTLVEHLTELRSRLLRSLLAVVVGGIGVWFAYPLFIEALRELLLQGCPDDVQCSVIQQSPIQGLSTRLTVSGYGGLAVALPVLLWQVWRFVTPGLYRRERRLAAPFVLASYMLFLGGVALAWLVLPKGLAFLAGFGAGTDQLYSVNEYTGFVVKTAIGFGIGFEFPVLLVFLQLVGVIDHRKLNSWRPYAAVVIVLLAAVITPGGDFFSLVALSVPMYVLYEASIVIGWVIARRRRRRAAEVS